jgi:hypothetical protein
MKSPLPGASKPGPAANTLSTSSPLAYERQRPEAKSFGTVVK